MADAVEVEVEDDPVAVANADCISWAVLSEQPSPT